LHEAWSDVTKEELVNYEPLRRFMMNYLTIWHGGCQNLPN